MPCNIELAKRVVKVLRHKAGLTFDRDGFVTLRELLQLRRFSDACEEDIWNEANADKRRFDVRVVGGCKRLRATYKHSV